MTVFQLGGGVLQVINVDLYVGDSVTLFRQGEYGVASINVENDDVGLPLGAILYLDINGEKLEVPARAQPAYIQYIRMPDEGWYIYVNDRDFQVITKQFSSEPNELKAVFGGPTSSYYCLFSAYIALGTQKE